MSQVQVPALTVMVTERINKNSTVAADAANWNRFALTANTYESASNATYNFSDSGVADTSEGRHLGTNNILYTDGHVKQHKESRQNQAALPCGADPCGSATGQHGHPFNNTISTTSGYGTWINTAGDLPN